MTRNAKTILYAVGIAAVLASPAMAKTNHQTPSQVNAGASAGQRAGYDAPAQTVYAPNVRVPAHNNGLNPDFQLSTGE